MKATPQEILERALEIVREESEDRANVGEGIRALGRKIGTDHKQLMRGRNGDKMSVDTVFKLIRFIGGDIERAMPGWQPRLQDLEFQVLDLRTRLSRIAEIANMDDPKSEIPA